jgi:hypothetical protein
VFGGDLSFTLNFLYEAPGYGAMTVRMSPHIKLDRDARHVSAGRRCFDLVDTLLNELLAHAAGAVNGRNDVIAVRGRRFAGQH